MSHVDPSVADIAGPVIAGAFAVVVTLVQRGRRETTDRFDRVAKTLERVESKVDSMDDRQDRQSTAIRVLENEVGTIKDRHHLMDMIKAGRHRGLRRGLWLAAVVSTWLLVGGKDNART